MKPKEKIDQFAAAQRVKTPPSRKRISAEISEKRRHSAVALTDLTHAPSEKHLDLLHRAVCENNVDAAIGLLHESSDVLHVIAGKPLLHHAVENGHAEMTLLLLSRGADVDGLGLYGNTALHEGMLSLTDAKLRIVELLLLAGANPNIQNAFGQTPLHFHVQSSRELYQRGAEFLIQSGAQLHHTDIKGNKPFDRLSPLIKDALIEYALEIRLRR